MLCMIARLGEQLVPQHYPILVGVYHEFVCCYLKVLFPLILIFLDLFNPGLLYAPEVPSIAQEQLPTYDMPSMAQNNRAGQQCCFM